AANSSFSSDVRSRKVETLVDGDGTVHDARYRLSDWGLIPPEGNDLDPPGTGGMGLSNAAFDAFFAATFPGLTAFSASDFLVKGGKHAVNHLNTDPPKAL